MKVCVWISFVAAIIAFVTVGPWYDETYGFEGSLGAAMGAALVAFFVVLVVLYIIKNALTRKTSIPNHIDNNEYIKSFSVEETKSQKVKSEHKNIEDTPEFWYQKYLNSKLTKEIVDFLSDPTLPYKIVVEMEKIVAFYGDEKTKTYNLINEKVGAFGVVFYTTYSDGKVYGDTINKPLRFAEAINTITNDSYVVKEVCNNQAMNFGEENFKIHTTVEYIELTFRPNKEF